MKGGSVQPTSPPAGGKQGEEEEAGKKNGNETQS